MFISFSFVGFADAAKNPNKPTKPQKAHIQSNINGTITAINGNTIILDVKNKKTTVSKTVKLNNQTRFNVKKDKSVKGETKPTASITNFKVGDNVNINGKPNDDGTMTARILRLTPPKHKKK